VKLPPILTGWWRAAEAAARLICWPRTDVAAMDAAAGAVFARSAVVRGADTVLGWCERAWTTSTARAMVIRLNDAIPKNVVLRRRFFAIVVIIAGLTVLALQSVKPGPREPLAWFLPAMTIAAAVLIVVAAALRHDEAGESRE
jgi:hypothetical protein